MCESGRSRETIGRHIWQPTDTGSNDTSRRLKLAALKKRRGKIRLNTRLTCGGPVTANERSLGVDVVHKCFPERSNSILYKHLLLGAIANEAARQLASFSG